MKTYLLRNLRFPVRREWLLEAEVARKLHLPMAAFQIQRVVRKAVDTRRFNQPVYDFTLELSFIAEPPLNKDLSRLEPVQTPSTAAINTPDPHPFIIGMGPAGLFCALAMVENGLRPYLFDRGDPLGERAAKVNGFWQTGVLDEDSNVQFGEGGAGTWSDGKLTSRGRDPVTERIYREMIRFGAPGEIAWEALPHLGTDGIRALVLNIRNYLVEQGCRFHYRNSLQDMEIEQERVTGVRIGDQWFQPELVVLGLGNSARETFRMLHQRGVLLEPKPLALGLRIEQKQALINRLIHGGDSWAELLGPASYRLTAPTGFTFCMCPGGRVIAASAERNTVVTNGMSFSARQDPCCNSAIVTPVTAKDYGSGLWDAMKLQESLERSAFQNGYLAPAQSAESFLGAEPDPRSPETTYLPGIYPGDLNQLFPPEIAARLRSALQRFDQILPGFYRDAVLIAPETRTSSPVRIIRHQESLNSVSASNLYPIGEGSGYAGGIVSSAADGWNLGCRIRSGE